MAATIALNQRNGAYPGIITQNISGIYWKAVDNTTTSYTNAVIALGKNSYTVWVYLSFAGVFTTIGNVQVVHGSGVTPSGIRVLSSASATSTSTILNYTSPSSAINSAITPNDMSAMNSTINLLVGNALNAPDPASYGGKSTSADNDGVGVYTNYFVTQLCTTPNATTGDLAGFAMEITFDEL